VRKRKCAGGIICLTFEIATQKAMNGIQIDTKILDLAHECLGNCDVGGVAAYIQGGSNMTGTVYTCKQV